MASRVDVSWIFPILMGVVVVAAIVSAIVGGRRKRRNLQALAQRLGLDYVMDDGPKFSFTLDVATSERDATRKVCVEGTIRGRRVEFSEFTTSAGRSSQRWTEVAVAAVAGDFEFSLQQEGLGWKLMRWLGDEEVTIGDREFDAQWHIKASSPDTLQAMLLPELRGKITAAGLSGTQGHFMLFDGWMRYIERGGFEDPSRVARGERVLGLLSDLAVAAEVAAK